MTLAVDRALKPQHKQNSFEFMKPVGEKDELIHQSVVEVFWFKTF